MPIFPPVPVSSSSQPSFFLPLFCIPLAKLTFSFFLYETIGLPFGLDIDQ